MNVVIMQPFYLFLRKHFHQIYRADVYVFLDDVQFVRRGHHNRNRIKGPNGITWLTVPVKKKGKYFQTLQEVEIDNSVNWPGKHWKNIETAYSRSPYFKDYAGFFRECYEKRWNNLCDLNIYLIKNISQMLGISNRQYLRSSELGMGNENPTQRLIDICEYLGASKYIIGTRAKDYMQEELWTKTPVQLEYFEPGYPPYPQLWGGDFYPYCAIIDLLFNCGPRSGEYIWGSHFEEYQRTGRLTENSNYKG